MQGCSLHRNREDTESLALEAGLSAGDGHTQGPGPVPWVSSGSLLPYTGPRGREAPSPLGCPAIPKEAGEQQGSQAEGDSDPDVTFSRWGPRISHCGCSRGGGCPGLISDLRKRPGLREVFGFPHLRAEEEPPHQGL